MKQIVLALAFVFLVVGTCFGQGGQPAPSTMSVSVSGNVVTVMWTNPRKWLNPNPVQQGFLVTAYVKNGGNKLPYVIYQTYTNNVFSASYPMASGTYIFSVSAVSAGFPVSNAKSDTAVVP